MLNSLPEIEQSISILHLFPKYKITSKIKSLWGKSVILFAPLAKAMTKGKKIKKKDALAVIPSLILTFSLHALNPHAYFSEYQQALLLQPSRYVES